MSDERAIYARRFSSNESYRSAVWKTLVRQALQPHIPADAHVLDLGCGYGDFINTVRAAKRFAIDLNPDSRAKVASDVAFIEQDCTQRWPVADESLDVIFSSNFFEHLPSRQALMQTLEHARRALRRGGKLIALGPNIRYLPGAYWDFIDHQIALSDRSLVEAMELAGLSPHLVIDRFLPYTISEGANPPIFLVSLYLRLPLMWRFLGKQFLIIAKRNG